MVYKRKKCHYGDTHLKKKWRTKRRTKDLDQIDEDIKPENSSRLLNQEVDLDVPGSAQHYCIHCARYFINNTALQDHFKTKVHKRRLKALELEPYTIEESERAAGFGNWKTASKRKLETQPQSADNNSEDIETDSPTLYITGDKAQKTFAVITPVVDFEKRLANKEALVQNFKARGFNRDVNKIEQVWKFFHDIDETRKTLELTRTEIGKWIRELMKDEEKNKDEIEKYKLHSKLVKEDLQNVKTYFYSLEEDTMLQLLDLPNVLHEKTPLELVTVQEFLKNVDDHSLSHMEIAEKLGLIEYIDRFTCYLKSNAALFEIGILNYFRHTLQDFNYTQFSNPDFCRSVIVEGCGINYKEKKKVFLLDKFDNSKDEINRLHLCGGGTLYPFMAYFSRHSVQQTHFPLKYFSMGKRYVPLRGDSPRNLFNLSQETVISIFTATFEEEDILEEITKQVTTLYESLGYHFRLAYLPASELEKSESLRLSVQMYSNYCREYVEVGNISVYDSYLSKRLLFNYTVDKERKYPKVIAGTVLNFPKLLGCVLENNSVQDANLMTSLIQKYMFI